jgi:hypothetical protein
MYLYLPKMHFGGDGDVLGMGGRYALGGLCGGCGSGKERARGGVDK